MNNQKYKIRLIVGSILFICTTAVAFANAGVPMIFIAFPIMLFALIPIIVVEAFVIQRSASILLKNSFRVSIASNLFSTLIGIPITWIILTALELIITRGGRAYGLDTIGGKFISIVVQAPWLIPYEADLYWLIPSATLVLLVPFFFISWFSEFWIAKMMLMTEGSTNKKLKKAILLANSGSYILLALFVVFKFLIEKKN